MAVRSPAHCSKVILALAAPKLAQKPPTGQRSHAVASIAGLNLPMGHASQLALLVFAASCPGIHGRQMAPVTASERLPLGQEAQRGAYHVLGSMGLRSADESE